MFHSSTTLHRFSKNNAFQAGERRMVHMSLGSSIEGAFAKGWINTKSFFRHPLVTGPFRLMYNLSIGSLVVPVIKAGIHAGGKTIEGAEIAVRAAKNAVVNTAGAVIAVPRRSIKAVLMNKKMLVLDNAGNVVDGMKDFAVASTRDLFYRTLSNGASAFGNSMRAIGNLMLFNVSGAKERANEAVGDARASVHNLFRPVTSIVDTAGHIKDTTKEAYLEYVKAYQQIWEDEKKYVGGVRNSVQTAVSERNARHAKYEAEKAAWQAEYGAGAAAHGAAGGGHEAAPKPKKAAPAADHGGEDHGHGGGGHAPAGGDHGHAAAAHH